MDDKRKQKAKQRYVARKKAYIRAKRQKERRKQLIKTILLALILTMGLSAAIFSFLFGVQRVEGFGMTPTLVDSDWIVISKYKKIKRFSVVSFKTPGKENKSFRRVIGLPGETIEYRDDTLWVNGQEQPERFLLEAKEEARENNYSLTENFDLNEVTGSQLGQIPADMYLVLGDNRTFSADSRNYGLVSKDDILGVAELLMFPIHKMRSF